MNRIKYLIAPFVLSLFLLPATGVLAQEDDTPVLYDTQYDYDYDYDWESLDSYFDNNGDLSEEETAGIFAGSIFAFLFAGVWLTVSLALSVGTYVYTALALSKIGQKLGYEKPWFAWVPVLNLIMLLQLGDQNPWLLLLALIPGIGAIALAIIFVIASMRICEKRGYDRLLGLLTLVPLASLVLLGVLAWKENDQPAVATA